MYKCRCCNHKFYEWEQETHREKHDDYYSEYFDVCPVCGSNDYEETLYCKICGEEFLKEELYGGKVCEDCIDEFVPDKDNKFGKDDTAQLAILRFNLSKNEQKDGD